MPGVKGVCPKSKRGAASMPGHCSPSTTLTNNEDVRPQGRRRTIHPPVQKNPLMYHRILVPLDGSATAERGLREAMGLAALHKPRLLVIHVVDDFSSLVELSPVASYQRMKADLGQLGNALLGRAHMSASEIGLQAETSLIQPSLTVS